MTYHTWQKLASICSVALGELDPDLYEFLCLLLSDKTPIMDNLVQEAALKAMTVLVQSFPEIARELVHHLRRFVTSPLPIFEFAFNTEKRSPPPLTAAAKCFGLCVKVGFPFEIVENHFLISLESWHQEKILSCLTCILS